jgi:hypothetical protein
MLLKAICAFARAGAEPVHVARLIAPFLSRALGRQGGGHQEHYGQRTKKIPHCHLPFCGKVAGQG